MSPRSSNREREDEPFAEESLSDESDKGSKELSCNDGSSFPREPEDFTCHLLPSAEDSESVPRDIEETPSESPLSLPPSRGSSTEASRRSSPPTSRGSGLSYDDLTSGCVGTFRAPSHDPHDGYFKVSQLKGKMASRDVHAVDDPELVGERPQGNLYKVREKTSRMIVTANDNDLVSRDASPVSRPGHDLHHLKTRVIRCNEKVAPSEVQFDETRPIAHQTGLDEDPPSVSHDFVNPPTKSY